MNRLRTDSYIDLFNKLLNILVSSNFSFKVRSNIKFVLQNLADFCDSTCAENIVKTVLASAQLLLEAANLTAFSDVLEILFCTTKLNTYNFSIFFTTFQSLVQQVFRYIESTFTELTQLSFSNQKLSRYRHFYDVVVSSQETGAPTINNRSLR